MEEGTVEIMTEVIVTMVANMTVAMIGIAVMIGGMSEDMIVATMIRDIAVNMIVIVMRETRTNACKLL
jgi:hypothetical protein